MLSIIDEVGDLIFFGEGFLFKFTLSFMKVLEVFVVVFEDVEDVVVVEGIAYCKVFGKCIEMSWLPSE